MADPTTTNTGLAIPLRGSDVGTWDTPVNADFSAIDGYFGGVQIISASSAPITLTSPAGFTPTPSGGPTQAQNAVLRVTGTLSAPVQVTLPLPGPIVIENLTTGNFVLSFRAIGSGEIIAVDQGEAQHVYNDGTNVRFINLGRIGHTEMWAGLSTMPAWVTACTKRPYLLCDGAIYNFSDFPYLGAKLQGSFGGNGITTFGVPSSGGRIQLPYDNTGTRITSAVSGINGQTLGASADNQGIILTAGQIPSITSSVSGTAAISSSISVNSSLGSFSAGSGGAEVWFAINNGAPPTLFSNPSVSGSATSNNTDGAIHSNVQPAQVTGIAVIRAA